MGNALKITGIVLAAAFSLVLCSAAPAIAKNWNTTNGNWNTAANWSPAAVPTAGEAVNIVFTDGVARTVTYDVSAPTLGRVAIDLTGAGATTDTLSITGNFNLLPTALDVGGYNGTGTPTNGRGANQTNGLVQTSSGSDLSIASGTTGSTGTYTLSGSGAVNAQQSEFVGYRGNGTFTQTSGSNTLQSSSVGTLTLGLFGGSSGTYNLSGGSLVSNVDEVVGNLGTGNFIQSGGTNTIQGTKSLYLGQSNGSNGTYTLTNGASLTVTNNLSVGVSGTGTFNHSDGTVTLSTVTGGSLTLGVSAGSTGNYNLNGPGALVTLKSQYIGNLGTGVFTQSAGSNRLTNALSDDLYIGFDTGSVGTYSISGGLFETAGNVSVGVTGTGTLNISGSADFRAASGANTLTLGPNGRLNITGGKLKFSNLNKSGSAILNYTAGAIQIPGDRTLNATNLSDPMLNNFFPRTDSTLREISAGKELIVEGTTQINDFSFVSVNGGKLTSFGALDVGLTGSPSENSTLLVRSGGTAQVAQASFGTAGKNGELWVDQNSTFRATNGIQVGGGGSVVAILQTYDSFVDAGSSLTIGAGAIVHIENSTLRFGSYSRASSSTVDFLSGTIDFVGSRTIGSDPTVAEFFGGAPTLPRGKGLVVEGTSTLVTPLLIDHGTFKTDSLVVAAGGTLDFEHGTLELNGGNIQGLSQLVVPADSEFRGNGQQSLRIVGDTGSTMTATGDWQIGNPAAANGFYTNGTLNTRQYTVTFQDANDAVLDSGALVSLSDGTTAGAVNAANGLTLDFGANITGFGTVSMPNNAAKPLINNGHITGTSPAQKITLTGYVKGVGTFDNVTMTGTFSPGLSPTTAQVGNLGFASGSTLIMELGGTTPGSAYDQIQSSGALTFDGTLTLSLINSFTPSAGQSFDLFDWSSVSGMFASLNLPTLAPGLTWNTSQLYTTGVLSVVSAGIPGDYNNNGTVDAGDYVLYRKYAGTTHVLPNDPTGGTIGSAQYTTWRSNFGRPPGSGSGMTTVTIPEPSTSVLLLMAMVSACGRMGRGTRPSRNT